MTGSELSQFIVAMIIMMNPLGSLSIFLDLMHGSSMKKQRKIAKHTTLAIFIIMLLSLWGGRGFLTLLDIKIDAFRFAGGIILLLMGLSMLQSKDSPVQNTMDDDVPPTKERHSIAIVPLALPVIVGPGTISTLIITAGDFPQLSHRIILSVACLVLTLGMGLMLYFAAPIAKLVGVSIIKVITRIMGMVIMAIAVGMLADGLIGLFPMLH